METNKGVEDKWAEAVAKPKLQGRAGGGYLSGKKMVDKINLSGSEKQIAYARDIMRRPFDFIERNISYKKELINKSKTESGKRAYREQIADIKEFGKYISKNVYKPATELKQPMKASSVIDHQSRYDGDKLFNTWYNNIRKK